MRSQRHGGGRAERRPRASATGPRRGLAAAAAAALLAAGAVAPAAAQETWVVGPGKGLRAQLEEWSSSAGWTLVWQNPAYDMDLGSGVALRGSFEEAVVSLVESIPSAEAILYRGNKTLVVTIKGSDEQ